jgi:hypothetical protein
MEKLLNFILIKKKEKENGKAGSTIGTPSVTVKRRQATKPVTQNPTPTSHHNCLTFSYLFYFITFLN